MVQRYDVDSPSVCFEAEDGYFVKYEDYAALRALMCRLTDHVNLCELPDGLYEKLEEMGLL